MRCANCGNNDPKSLFDEGDTFYCNKCNHRTQSATGQDDLVTCPYCGRFRDRKAYQCWWCGHSASESHKPTKEEYEALDKILTEHEKSIDPSSLRYGKILGKKKR